MSPAVDTLERALAERRSRLGSHPVLTWYAANAVILRDTAGNRKLDKAKLIQRIDGVVALAIALSITE